MVLTDDRIVIALGKADDFVHAGRASLLTAHGRNWTSGRAARLDFFDPSGAGMLPIFGDGSLIGFGPDQTRPADPDAVLARIEVVLHAARELWESQASDDDQAEPNPYPPGQVVPDFVADLDEMAVRLAHACGMLPSLDLPSDNGGWFHNLMHRLGNEHD